MMGFVLFCLSSFGWDLIELGSGVIDKCVFGTA